MEDLQLFAGNARRFHDWIQHSSSEGGPAAREALLELVALYGAALNLPSAFRGDSENAHYPRVGDVEFNHVRTWCRRLPFQHYGEVFDPSVIPPEEPVVGDVSNDIADVYRDVTTGLRAFDAGLFDDALWEWGFGFRTHWGKHAVDAIRALHLWLASNEPDLLEMPKPPGAA